MHRNDLEAYLSHYLKVASFKDDCPNGLQIEGKSEVTRIATAVSADLMSVEKAVAAGVDALIVHHGLFWKSDSYPLIGSKRKKIGLLLENQLSLFAYHLPLDAHMEVGNNWKAALDLGWQELVPFAEYHGSLIGVRGLFAEQPIESLILQVETYYGHPATRVLAGKSKVASAALVSGGAYKALLPAAQAAVDCLITGNFDEPAWAIAHEEKIHFLALGHAATEKVGPKALAAHLEQRLGLATLFIDTANPF